MKYRRSSRDKQVSDRLVALVQTASERQGQSVDEIPSIGFAIDEAVKEAMRKLAQESSGFRDWQELLRVAVDMTAESLAVTFGTQRHFNIDSYLEVARKSLSGVAKEIHRLNRNWQRSKREKRVYDKERTVSEDEAVEGEITKLGLLGSVEGLLARPVADSSMMNIDAIKAEFQVTGDWFPYEVHVDNLVYVVDDDGSVFVSTENFPDELVERAQRTLTAIANCLNS